jgi:hypothetical protein
VTVDNAVAQTCPCSIWTNQTKPHHIEQDPYAVEVGMRFRADVAGKITGIRFYKGSKNTGTHVGHLRTNNGQLLASVTFKNETSSGWQQATLPTPVAIAANTTYVVSYYTTVGYYAVTEPGLAAEVANPPLRALADGEDGPNGVYKYGASGFPTDTYNASNYWVDVVFVSDDSKPPAPVASGTDPTLPQLTVDTTMPTITGNTYTVSAGGSLQAALNAAAAADPNRTHLITLQAGATFTGPFTLPARAAGSGWVLIRTSAIGSLPGEGRRVGPSQANLMPKLVAGQTVLTAGGNAHHYRLIGVEITPTTFVYNLVDLRGSHLILDRSYLHGHASQGTRRGIAMNGTHQAVIDSYLADFKEVGADSQAICGWTGAGPFKIQNNMLQGAGENIMFGGADPSVTNLVPSDIEIRGNDVSKPLSWKVGHPSYAGTKWTVKNLLELKNARRVLIDGNLFEHNWVQADQQGFAVLFRPANQNGGCPWCTAEDITFTNNIVRHTGAGINILGEDDYHTSAIASRILIRNNLLHDINSDTWGPGAYGFVVMISSGTVDVTIEHNTGLANRATVYAYGTPNVNFIFRNNITEFGLYGVAGDGVGSGNEALTTYFPDAVFQRNVLAGDNASSWQNSYPPDNDLLPSLDDVGFVDLAGGDYLLSGSSPYCNAATDGADIGANIDALME